MRNKSLPIVITCGDPAGVGPEVAVSAWKALKDEIPLCILIDPDFLPKNINIKILDQVPLISDVEKNVLTVIRHKFPERRVPGKPNTLEGTGGYLKNAMAATGTSSIKNFINKYKIKKS